MVGSSKILTVSYGTFSCTLEGFDDPFSTMRSIAEYFRDLASDDRYFGAEPPTPDAEMLHRIAEREVQRRVEARINGDSVLLRQVGGDEKSKTGSADARPSDAAAAVRRAASPAPEARGTSTAETAADGRDPVGTSADTGSDGFGAYAEDDDPDYEDAAAYGGAVEFPDGWNDEAEDEDAAQLEAAYGEDDGQDASGDVREAHADERQPGAETSAIGGSSRPAAAAGDAVARAAAAPETDDSVAAKLSRIRAVVSGTGRDGVSAASGTMYSGAIERAFADAAPIEDADFEDVLETGEAWQAASDAGRNEDPAESVPHGPVAEGPESAPGDEGREEETAQADEDIYWGLAAQIVEMKRSEAGLSAAPDGESEEDQGFSLSEDDEADLMAELAEAERADLEDVEAAAGGESLESEDPSEMEDDDAFMEDHAKWSDIEAETSDYDSRLGWEDPVSEDDEESVAEVGHDPARLAGEQAAGEQDDNDDFEGPEMAPANDQPAGDAKTMHRHPGFDTAKTEEAAFDRILEQTNSRMDESEGSRRRSAIAHLKAAVAATKADRLLKRMRPDDQAAEEQSRYRDDLAKVVQPRRPLTEPRDAVASEAPSMEKPSPLMLVSEQRVDAHGDGPEDFEADVLPRRVNTTRDRDASIPDESGFAAFAERVGATDLPDLLEAAAAYTAFVEGNKLFSRPQLMRRVAHMDRGDEFTREAGLRSFGQLLRQGKIQKLKRGQFTISEDTRFNPQARLAGE